MDKTDEVIGIAEMPERLISWTVYHYHTRAPTYIPAQARQITKAEYTTYEEFGFPVFECNLNAADRTAKIYDPRYFVVRAGYILEV